MPDPINWRSKILLAKIETVYGTDAVPTGADNAILAVDVTLAPMEGEDVSRNLERPFLGAQEEFKVGLRSVLTFSTELVGAGATGVAPAWGSLARACGLAEVVTPDVDPDDGTVVYKPVSTGHESVSIYFLIGGTRHVMKGCRGTGVITANAQGVPVIRWTMTGLFAMPSEQTRPTVDFSDFKTPSVVTNTNTPVFTLGAVALVMRSFELNLGCDVQPRMLVGREEIRIVDRAEQISCSVEAVPLTTFNPFDRALSLTPTAVALTHGTVAGFKTSIAVPTGSVARLTGYEQQQNLLEWPLRVTPIPSSAGDDQFTLTLH
ncbi:MAG: hypothetical protein J0H17_03930 [Rhizobiales bacterium]|nr:hypothetical protein [Hyphomicrobiales bacterium]